MQSANRNSTVLSRWLALLTALLPLAAMAFPPAPPHQIYGIVRDQIGNPLSDGAEVIFEASSGVILKTFVVARSEPGVNYSLDVPMDAGLTSDLYNPTALMPTAPFRLRVKVGKTTFLPIEMTGNLSTLGHPGGRTRIDLTLGVDSDGNGLPDAWEQAVAAFLGRKWQSGQIRPDDLYPGTGMTYRQVYLAGTYAVSPTEGFALQIVHSPGTAPNLAFTAVKGRTYTLQAASVLGQWTDVSFRLLPLTSNAAPLFAYQATETRRIEIEPPLVGEQPARFFRLIVR